MRRWWVLVLLLLALLGLQLRFWWGEGGWDQAQKLQARAAAQRAENALLKQRNDALEAEVEDLKSGEAAVEERARSELGMIKPGEVFYRVVEPSATSTPSPSGNLPLTAPGTAPVPAAETAAEAAVTPAGPAAAPAAPPAAPPAEPPAAPPAAPAEPPADDGTRP